MTDRWNAALGCKTDEVALALLAQVVGLEHPTADTSESQIDDMLMNATALLAELEPPTATEALLAAQMIGAQERHEIDTGANFGGHQTSGK